MNQNRYKNLILLIVVAVCLLVGVALFRTISRSGKELLIMNVAPSSASTWVDGKATGSSVYVNKGKHRVQAKLAGFSSYDEEISVSREVQVDIALRPVDPDGEKYLSSNPEAQLELQARGDAYATEVGKKLSNYSGFLSQIPHEGIIFQVNSGAPVFSKASSSNPVALYIDSDDAEARKFSLDWIREQGVNPTDFEIVFSSSPNPFDRSDRGGN